MNKVFRLMIAILLLVGILFLARNHIAWAKNSNAQNDKVALLGSDQSNLGVDTEPGSVKPPPIIIPIIPRTGGTSIGGICTVFVDNLAQDINLRAELLGYDSLKEKPKDNPRFLAGVCHLTYQRSGLIIPVLAPNDGNVRICFAALPKIEGKVRVYDEQAWTILDTILQELTNCAPANMTGKYVLSTTQP
jgi:hypothetical protein